MLNKLVITVSQLNSYIKSIFEFDKNLKNIFVSGEVSNFRGNYQSGHLYFSLKEGDCVIRAVMFAVNARRLRFHLRNGMNIIVRGNVLCYEVNGQYQIYVDDIQPYGIGSYFLEFEQLKEKLSNEGLFSKDRKKSIPKYPKKIGIITSVSGAAIRDIENVLNRRYPIAEIIVYPVQVQGSSSVSQIIDAINKVENAKEADVVILARGGGAIEELWTFNDEGLARAISNCVIPVISAVGHETDFTICDFVADKRAPTPSAAAEICTPDIRDLAENIKILKRQMKTLILNKIEFCRCNYLAEVKCFFNVSPMSKIVTSKQEILQTENKLSVALKKSISDKKITIGVLLDRLKAMNPKAVMRRGYSIITDENGVISQKEEIKENKSIRIKFFDGEIECRITGIRSIY